MKYKRQEKKNNSLTIRTQNYLESDSFEEYRISCVLMGIHLNKWRDAYWYRYLYFNCLGDLSVDFREGLCYFLSPFIGFWSLVGLLVGLCKLNMLTLFISFPIFVLGIMPMVFLIEKQKTDQYIDTFLENNQEYILDTCRP